MQVADAAAAQAGVFGSGADIGAHVPAAFALGVAQGADIDAGFAFRTNHRGRRGDEHEAQIVAERGEQVVIGALGLEDDIGLQRRADLAGGAQFLNALGRQAAQLAQPRFPRR
jgi:hypothetical protein